MSFEILNRIAFYDGRVDVADIALAVFTVQDQARDQAIDEFLATIPNAQFDVIAKVSEIVGVKPMIEPKTDSVTMRYKFERIVSVKVIGSRALTPTVPDTLDLAHRIVTAPTRTGIESL